MERSSPARAEGAESRERSALDGRRAQSAGHTTAMDDRWSDVLRVPRELTLLGSDWSVFPWCVSGAKNQLLPCRSPP